MRSAKRWFWFSAVMVLLAVMLMTWFAMERQWLAAMVGVPLIFMHASNLKYWLHSIRDREARAFRGEKIDS